MRTVEGAHGCPAAAPASHERPERRARARRRPLRLVVSDVAVARRRVAGRRRSQLVQEAAEGVGALGAARGCRWTGRHAAASVSQALRGCGASLVGNVERSGGESLCRSSRVWEGARNQRMRRRSIVGLCSVSLQLYAVQQSRAIEERPTTRTHARAPIQSRRSKSRTPEKHALSFCVACEMARIDSHNFWTSQRRSLQRSRARICALFSQAQGQKGSSVPSAGSLARQDLLRGCSLYCCHAASVLTRATRRIEKEEASGLR